MTVPDFLMLMRENPNRPCPPGISHPRWAGMLKWLAARILLRDGYNL